MRTSVSSWTALPDDLVPGRERMRWVNPSSATESPSRTCIATASASGMIAAGNRLSALMFARHTGVRCGHEACTVRAHGGGDGRSKQHLQSLERGIAVIEVFSHEHPSLTLSEVARLTGMTRATARRILLTLEKLGHVRSDGRRSSLPPHICALRLGVPLLAEPLGDRAAPDRGVTRSATYSAQRSISPTSSTSATTTRRHDHRARCSYRLPAHATSMGRVLPRRPAAGRAGRLPVRLRAQAVHPAHDRRPATPCWPPSPRCASRAGRSSTREPRSACASSPPDKERTDGRSRR